MINENTLNFLDKISELTGSYAVVGVLIAGILLCIEVVARYLFNFPITWIPLVATEICAVVYFMVGAYTMLFKGHVAMDIFYERASKKRQAVLDIIKFIFFSLFIGVLLWTGFEEMLFSVSVLETTPPPWSGPLWPVKIFMVVGTILLMLQGISNLGRSINVLFSGDQ